MKKFKWRFAFAGLVFALAFGAGGTAYAAFTVAKIPLYHHHCASCIGYEEVTTEADGAFINTLVRKEVCPVCGGELHYYSFRAECSCGKSWNSDGYACENSIYGDNPAGGCPNYEKVDGSTLHTHMVETYVCGMDEKSLLGEIAIEVSDTEPVYALTLTASYSGSLKEPSYEWSYRKMEETEETTETEGKEEATETEKTEEATETEKTEEATETEETEETTEDESGDEEDSNAGKEGDTKEQEGGLAGTDGGDGTMKSEEDEDVQDADTGEENPDGEFVRPQKSSSISVKQNGIYTLTAGYEEDGIRYSVVKSVRITNIIPKPEPNPASQGGGEKITRVSPASETVAPALPKPDAGKKPEKKKEPEEDANSSEEENALFVIRPLPVSVMVEEILGQPLENDSKENENPLPGEDEKKGSVWERTGRYFYTTWKKMPVEAKMITVTTGGLIGMVMVLFGTGMLGKTASVYWVDENNRKHFMEKAGIRKGIGKYEVHIRKEAILLAKSADLSICMPGIFTLLHKYRPVTVYCEGNTYALHVQKEIRITAGGWFDGSRF